MSQLTAGSPCPCQHSAHGGQALGIEVKGKDPAELEGKEETVACAQTGTVYKIELPSHCS